jgi:pilus assembly protein CpaB
MNRKSTTVLVMAFLIASVCTFLVWRVLANNIAAAHRASVKKVVAASGNIRLGTVLTAANLTTIEIAGSLPKGTIQDRKDVIGRGVISDLYDGEPILESRLAAPGSGGGLAATIPTGMRVAAIKVDDVVGVAGFATPGMRVDVLGSGNPPGNQVSDQGPLVKTLLQNIEVKSAGTDIQKDAEGKPHQVQVVNLLVTPEQAETLSLASSQMKIQLVLRNPLDTEIAKVPGSAMATLFSGVAGPPAPKPRIVTKAVPKPERPVYSVEVINGSKHSEASFAAPEGKQ